MEKVFNVLLDTKDDVKNPAFVVNTNDLKTVKINVLINQDGNPLDLTGATVRLAVRKPDKTTVLQDITVVNAVVGSCEIVLNTQAYVIDGKYDAEVMIYYDVDTVAVTGQFSYKAVRGILDDGSVESVNEWQSINQAIADAEALVNDLMASGTGIDAQARADLAQMATNVKTFGAKGDGVSDDSQAVNNAIDSIKANGGTVYFPPGTYVVAGIDILSKIHIKGSGVESTILKLKDNANQDVIYSNSVFTLSGTGSIEGENNFSISGLTIDGNRANNPDGGNGINVYGYDYTISSVRIRNCSRKGFISEWGQWGTPTPNGNMEAHIQDLKVSNCGTEGIDFAGPHDSQFVNVVVNNCNKQNWGASGILVRGNGSATFTNTHVWGIEHEVAYKLEGITHLVNCQGEGARSNVVILVNDCTVVGGYYYGFNPGEVGFVIGSADTTVSGTVVNTKVTNCQGGVINFVNDYSGSYTIKAFSSTSYATDKGILGTLNGNSYFFLMNEAPNGANIHKLPNGYTSTV